MHEGPQEMYTNQTHEHPPPPRGDTGKASWPKRHSCTQIAEALDLNPNDVQRMTEQLRTGIVSRSP